MSHQTQKPTLPIPTIWLSISIAATALLTLLAIGGYTLNWTWTGFTKNTVWDWLQLLILPITLTAITIWFSGGRKWRKEWIILVIGLGLVLLVLAIGGYVLHWTWTGFTKNTLWDWLQLLLLPVVLTVASIWFTRRQTEGERTLLLQTSHEIETGEPPHLHDIAQALDRHLANEHSALIAVIHHDHLPQVLETLKAYHNRAIIHVTLTRDEDNQAVGVDPRQASLS